MEIRIRMRDEECLLARLQLWLGIPLKTKGKVRNELYDDDVFVIVFGLYDMGMLVLDAGCQRTRKVRIAYVVR